MAFAAGEADKALDWRILEHHHDNYLPGGSPSISLSATFAAFCLSDKSSHRHIVPVLVIGGLKRVHSHGASGQGMRAVAEFVMQIHLSPAVAPQEQVCSEP